MKDSAAALPVRVSSVHLFVGCERSTLLWSMSRHPVKIVGSVPPAYSWRLCHGMQAAGGASGIAKAVAEAALAAAKSAASVRAAQEHGSVTVTETRRFAGKDVQARSVLCLVLRQHRCQRHGQRSAH